MPPNKDGMQCNIFGGRPECAAVCTIHLSVPQAAHKTCRQLVVEGLQRRQPAWRVTVDTGHEEGVTSAATTSDLHWGEYERMDWERIHDGGSPTAVHSAWRL